MQGQPSLAGLAPLKKQSAGLFFNSPYAERLCMECFALCGVRPRLRLWKPQAFKKA